MPKKTLYEILEVSENASSEIIEKAYKVLAKKYHPDLQPPEEKSNAENKMKEINEAYEILGDSSKREKYDEELKRNREEEKIREQNVNQSSYGASYSNQNYRTQNNGYTSNVNTNTNMNHTQNNSSNVKNQANYDKDRIEYEQRLRKEEAEQRRQMQENLNRQYANAYNDYLRSLGFKVKERWTKEKVRDLFIVIGIIIIAIVLLWIFPPTHDLLVNFYESNPILKTIIDIIIAIITGIFRGIWTFITGLFN